MGCQGKTPLARRGGLRRGLARGFAVLGCLLLATSARADDPEADAAASAKKADEAFKAQAWSDAADAYGAAVRVLSEAYEAAEEEETGELHRNGLQHGTPSPEIVAAIRTALAAHDRMEPLLGQYELGLARCQAHLNRPGDACRSVARALSYDLKLADGVRQDKHLATVKTQPEFLETLLRVDKGRGQFETGDPLDAEALSRAFQRNLRRDPGDAALYFSTDFYGELLMLAGARAKGPDKPGPGYEGYVRFVRMAVLVPKDWRGWPYLLSTLFERSPETLAIRAEAAKRLADRRDAPDGPFLAYVAYFPHVHLGMLKEAGEILEYLHQRSPTLYELALSGRAYLLGMAQEEHLGIPGIPSKDVSAALADCNDRFRNDPVALPLLSWTGYPSAMLIYGQRLLTGTKEFPKDPERGVRWLQGARQWGSDDASIVLADCLRQGVGIQKDPQAAFEMLEPIAEKGSEIAQGLMGLYYYLGIGVERDYERARDWYRQAAEKGNSSAMVGLGAMLHRGLGGEVDFEAARSWYQKAADAGMPIGVRRLGTLAFDTRMSADDLAKAGELLTKALSLAPDDAIGCMYEWSVLMLQGKAKAAQDVAKSVAAKMTTPGPQRDLVLALAKPRFDPAPILRAADQLKDAAERLGMIAGAQFIAGIQALAAKDTAKAKEKFQACVDTGDEDESVRFTSIQELKRLP